MARGGRGGGRGGRRGPDLSYDDSEQTPLVNKPAPTFPVRVYTLWYMQTSDVARTESRFPNAQASRSLGNSVGQELLVLPQQNPRWTSVLCPRPQQLHR